MRVGFKATAQVTPLLFGVPLPPYAHTAVESSSTVGPSLELLLPAHITFEASGLRKRMGYNDTIITSVGLGGPRRSVEYRDTTATLWEIPMLVKWRMREARVSPGYPIHTLGQFRIQRPTSKHSGAGRGVQTRSD